MTRPPLPNKPTMSQSSNKNSFGYINNVLVPFLKANGSKRVSQATYNYYKQFSILRPDTDEVLVSEEVGENGYVVAISCCAIRNEKDVIFSTTVVEKDYRSKAKGDRNGGHGTKVLKDKLEQLKERGLTLSTLIAEDNEPAVNLCNKVGMKVTDKIEKTRSTGFYTALIFRSK